MKHHRAGSANDVALLWLACAVVFCAGAYIAFGLLGAAIDAQHRMTGEISGSMRAQALTIAGRGPLERDADDIEERLRALHVHADKPTLVASFIRALTAVAASRHVEVEQIDEQAVAAFEPAAARAPAEPAAFEPTALDVTLGGSYRGLLAAVRDMAQAPVAMRIDIAALERASPTDGPGDAPLVAHIHVILERLNDTTTAAAGAPPIP